MERNSICLSIHPSIGPSAGWRGLRTSQRGLRASQRGLNASQEGWSYGCEERHTDGCTEFLPILLDCPLYLGHCLKPGKENLVISEVFFLAFGLWGGQLGWQMGDAPPLEADRVGQINDMLHSIVWQWLFSSLPTKTQIKQNLVIFVVIFCYFGAFKWKLGDAPPQKGDWVGVINTT